MRYYYGIRHIVNRITVAQFLCQVVILYSYVWVKYGLTYITRNFMANLLTKIIFR